MVGPCRSARRAWRVHGDVAASNLLVQSGRLAAVIDFGSCAIGDPACDLTLAWTFFTGSARRTFRAAMSLDDETWQRARGWALWKALILASGTAGTPDAARDAGVCSVSSSQKSEPSPIVPPPHMPPQWAGSHC